MEAGLTNYFNGFFVVKFFVPVEHPQEREGGQKNEANPEEHVARKAGKVNPLRNTKHIYIQKGKSIVSNIQMESFHC